MGCQCGFGGGSGGGGGGTFPPTAPTIVPAWFRIGTFDFSDFSTDNDVASWNEYDLPVKGVVHGLILTPVVQFAGVGLTSYTVSVGTAADETLFSGALDVLAAVPGDGVAQVTSPLLIQLDHVSIVDVFLWTRTTGTGLDGATAGQFTLDMLISVSP
jgi:hypothetical protein